MLLRHPGQVAHRIILERRARTSNLARLVPAVRPLHADDVHPVLVPLERQRSLAVRTAQHQTHLERITPPRAVGRAGAPSGVAGSPAIDGREAGRLIQRTDVLEAENRFSGSVPKLKTRAARSQRSAGN